jgi:hypothetical protein
MRRWRKQWLYGLVWATNGRLKEKAACLPPQSMPA